MRCVLVFYPLSLAAAALEEALPSRQARRRRPGSHEVGHEAGACPARPRCAWGAAGADCFSPTACFSEPNPDRRSRLLTDTLHLEAGRQVAESILAEAARAEGVIARCS